MPHYCYYSPLRKVMLTTEEGKRWLERCHCGNYKLVDCKFFNGASKSPKMSVIFFDSFGKRRVISSQKTLDAL